MHPLPPPFRPLAALSLVLVMAACADRPIPTGIDDTVLEARRSTELKKGKPDKGGDAPVVDDFDAWDGSRWTRGDHPLGLGWLDPANVVVAGGALALQSPANSFDGAEIKSVERMRFGTYEARIRAASGPGSLTAFFLYEFVDRNNDEIDIEIIPDFQGQGPHLMFTTWVRGRQTNNLTIPTADLPVPFDMADWHTYRIETSRKRVRFFVDDALVAEFRDGIPTAEMHLMANLWWPWWLYGDEVHPETTAEFDWIRY